jgi:hypothetical protein
MKVALTAVTIALAIAWIPLAWRFLRGWRNRKNPVSLAICAALCLFTYTNVLLALELNDGASWEFFAIATRVFDVIVVVNFYVAFKWSAKRFPEARSHPAEYTVPPMNATNTPRES